MLLTQPIHRILVLDDDEIMRGLLDTLLSLEGYEVTLTQSGEGALQALREDPSFDLVLTDLQMPGLEGQALAESLRDIIPPQTMLIGMSGSEPGPNTRAVFEAFIPKPFDLQLLRDAIEAAQARRAAIEEAERASSATRPPRSQTAMAPLDDKIFQSLLKMISAAQLSDLFAMALADIAKRHARIVAAAEADDLASAQREAHAIKGSCGMIGAAEIQNLAAAIEDGTMLNTRAIEEIPSACARLRRMLDSKLQTA